MRLTGKDAVILIGTPTATLIAATRRWEYEENDVDVDATAAGDDWNRDESLRGSFEINFEALMEVSSPYVLPTGLRGLDVAFALKVIDSHTNGLVSGTAKMSRFRISAPYDGMITISGMLKSAGVAPVFDLSPAT